MNGKDIFLGLKYIGDDLIEKAEYAQFPTRAEKTQRKENTRRRIPRPFLLAAVIALMLLLVGCAVAYVLKMESLKFGETTDEQYVFATDGINIIGTETVNQNILTLAGLEGSAPYKANAQWYIWREELLSSISRMEQEGTLPEGYWENGIYQQELQAKADELAEKYGLKPEGEVLEFRTTRNMCDVLGVERFQTTAEDVAVTVKSGDCYDNGSFWLNVDFAFRDGKEYDVPSTWGILRWNRKDCFSRDYILLEDSGEWKEWNYTTTSGSNVLILTSPSDWRGFIICDRDEALMSLQVEARVDLGNNVDGKTWFEYLYMTDRQMEQIADAIDFGIQPRIPTREDVENQPAAPNAPTQNGYTVKLKSVETDGWMARIIVGITAPEGTVISRNPHDGSEQYHIGPGNFDSFLPAAGEITGSNGGWNVREDGDGLENTQDLVLEMHAEMEDGSAPFGSGKVWNIHFEDLVGSYWDSEKQSSVEDYLAEGEWSIEVTFWENNGIFRQIEFAKEPVVLPGIIGWKPDGTDVFENVEVNSFTLQSMSAVIRYDYEGNVDFTRYDMPMYVVMQDGNRVLFQPTGGNPGITWYILETTIDPDQVDHVLLPDGRQLFAP